MTDLDNAVLRALKASGIRVKPLEWVPAPNICTREKAAALPGMTADHVRSITGHSAVDMVRLYSGKAMQRARAKEAQEGRK